MCGWLKMGQEGRRRLGQVLVPAVASLPLCGCAGFWDEVTSQNFNVKHFFNKPSPFVVLKESTDGDERAKALHALNEPMQNSGSQQDQDAVVKILVTAASTEKQALCRLAAIDALGSFKDPRAVAGLTDAFYNSTTFGPELATRIQCQAVQALGQTGNPQAVKFLVNVVKGPPGEGSEQEKQQVMDVRVAAARALGAFKDPQSLDALLAVLEKDKDVALRDCATASLRNATGKDLPPDAKTWQVAIHGGPGETTAVAESKHGPLQIMSYLFGD
jgi:HEAT repeat protein